MSFIFLRCKECGEEGDIYCDGDNAMMCPECRSVDEFEDPEDDEDHGVDFDSEIELGFSGGVLK